MVFISSRVGLLTKCFDGCLGAYVFDCDQGILGASNMSWCSWFKKLVKMRIFMHTHHDEIQNLCSKVIISIFFLANWKLSIFRPWILAKWKFAWCTLPCNLHNSTHLCNSFVIKTFTHVVNWQTTKVALSMITHMSSSISIKQPNQKVALLLHWLLASLGVPIELTMCKKLIWMMIIAFVIMVYI